MHIYIYIFSTLTCCILSKSKHGRCGRCSRWGAWCVRGGRRRGDIAQWNNFAGGLTERTSIDRADDGLLILLLLLWWWWWWCKRWWGWWWLFSVDDNDDVVDVAAEPAADDDKVLLLLSQEILILSMPRLVSVRISGVVARNKLWLRFGFRASKGGDVRKLTGGAGTGSSRFRT